jgi:outer membrane protein assembly factor BamB
MSTFGPSQLRGARHAHTVRKVAVRIVLPLASCAFVLGFNPVFAHDNDDPPGRTIGDTSVFATTPFPGHPFGIAVDSDAERVYVSTSRGDFFAQQTNSAGERIFAFDTRGHLLDTTSVTTMPDATMGLWGVALDGNRGRNHQLYVADMNGRILTLNVGDKHATPRVFATPPPPFDTMDWHTSMWNDLVFDRDGNLLMTDDKPRLWRVTPDGKASVWFQDDRLLGIQHFAGGPLGGRIDPSGRYFYFSITLSAPFPADALVYRLRISDHPQAADLQLVHRFPAVAGQVPPQASGLAFAKSGNLYVGLLGPNQIAVLDPAGNEVRRLSNPLFDSPWGLAFIGRSLLVSNADIQPVESPKKWIVSKVFVGEEGLPLNRPRTDNRDHHGFGFGLLNALGLDD